MKLLPDSKFPNKGLTCLSNFSNQQPITIASLYLPISLSNLLQPDLFIENTHLKDSQCSFFSLWESNITKHFTKISLSSQNDLVGGGNVSCRHIN